MQDHCKDCGLCCKKLIIEIDHVDIVREPRLLPVVTLCHSTYSRPCDLTGKPIYDDEWDKEYRLAPQPDSRICPMLGPGNRCGIYPTRPDCCVMFEVGGERCNELREGAGLPLIELEVSQ